jgi:hypothetical protein
VRVELLYTEDDPSYMAARQNLVEVLNEDAFETTIQMITVRSEADAAFLAFPGSPTIRIDGEDIDPSAVESVGLGHRTYPGEEGRAGASASVPGKQLIRTAVERARGWGHGRHE